MVRLSHSQGETSRRRVSAGKWQSAEDSPAECRQRRRRRMEMRRARPNWPPARPQLPRRRSPDIEEDEDDDDEDRFHGEAEAMLPRRWRLFRSPMPSFSEIYIRGFAETTHFGDVFVQEDFCPPQVFSGGEALHFFAVYHGHASSLFKQQMHRFVAEELASVDHAAGSDGDDEPPRSHRQWWNDHLLSALQRSFERIDRVALGASTWQSVQIESEERSAVAATVAILTADHIVVARCGGASRAVLCSDGIPIPLCCDRSDQTDQESCEVHNEMRGYEILQVSRPLGNQSPKSSGTTVTSEPEIFIIERARDEDESLILASDSVWNFISDDVACDVVNKCLRDGDSCRPTKLLDNNLDLNLNHNDDDAIEDDEDGLFPSTTGIDAATLLCRLALGRGSSKGISIVVVDLKSHFLV